MERDPRHSPEKGERPPNPGDLDRLFRESPELQRELMKGHRTRHKESLLAADARVPGVRRDIEILSEYRTLLLPERWRRMDLQDQIATLDTLEHALAAAQGRTAASIRLVPATTTVFPGTLEFYDQRDQTKTLSIPRIAVGRDALHSFNRALQHFLHESRHIYQLSVVEAPDLFKDVPARLKALWIGAKHTYPDLQTVVFPSQMMQYLTHPYEVDARAYCRALRWFIA